MDDRVSDEVARNRWLTINAVRIGGVAMVVIGLLILEGVVRSPEWAAYVLLVAGVIEVFLVPTVLTRKWRSPRP